VHELSIANNLVSIALEHAQQSGDVRVKQINLRIGALSCVHRDALMFSFDLVTAGTPLAGAKLHITDVPIVIYCPKCASLRDLLGVQIFRCPVCQTPSADIRQGRELDIESIEVVELGVQSPFLSPLVASEKGTSL
jgi:hydrogenase nickel incorporation protein HypA/HybF